MTCVELVDQSFLQGIVYASIFWIALIVVGGM